MPIRSASLARAAPNVSAHSVDHVIHASRDVTVAVAPSKENSLRWYTYLWLWVSLVFGETRRHREGAEQVLLL